MENDKLVVLFDVIGLMGGILNVVCLIPQIAHMYKTMDATGLHKRYFLLSLCGFSLDMIYLVSINAWAALTPMVLTVWYIIIKLIYSIVFSYK